MDVPPLVLNAMDNKYGVLVLLDPAKVMLMDQGPFMLFEISRTSFAGASFIWRARNSCSVRRNRTFGVRGWDWQLFHCLEGMKSERGIW